MNLRENSDQRGVHETEETLHNKDLQSLFVVFHLTLSFSLELHKCNDRWGILHCANDDSTTLDSGVLGDSVFNFTEFDTLTTKLDLPVSASTVFDVPIGMVQRNISRFVDLLPQNEGVKDEGTCGELRLV